MSKKLTVEHQSEELQQTNNIVLDIKFFLNKNYKLRKNVISRNIELNGNPIDDSILNSIFVNIKTNYQKTSKDLVNSIIFSDFIDHYNPFDELINHYIKNPPKIKRGYIDKFIKSIETDTPNADIFIKKWIVAIIASYHYRHSPLMLVLCGGQNTGKTEWFRQLLPKKWLKYYAESKLDAGKDDEILMTKKLIIMDDEMGGKSKMEQKNLKNMTSKQTFSVRAPYGRVSEDLHRIAMLCGTTNDEEILNDPTGNRRILPVFVKKVLFDVYNSIDKDLLFYEAYLLYKEGFKFELNSEDIELLKGSSSNFKQASPEEELVAKYYGVPGECNGIELHLSNSEIMSYIQTHSNTRLSQTKLGLILKEMGLEQKHHKFGKTTVRKYRIIQADLSGAVNPYSSDQKYNTNPGEDAPF